MFKIFVTPTFERSFKKASSGFSKKDYFEVLNILETDPLNTSRKYNIRKLKNLKPGVWRIRFGNYRIRYDVESNLVILHLISHRKDIYS